MDNLKAIETRVDADINPAGAPGSITAQNHNEILKDVLSKLGKYTGSPYLANKILTVFPSGSMSWNNNAMNNVLNFTITVSKLTADLNDFGEVLSRSKIGSLMRFKDYAGRSVDLLFQSYVAGVDGSANDIYVITVKGVAQNINYTYQDAEIEPCVFSVSGSASNESSNVIPDGKVQIFKGSGNLVVDGVLANVELEDIVIGFFGIYFIKGIYKNTLADNDRTNIGNYDLLSQDEI